MKEKKQARNIEDVFSVKIEVDKTLDVYSSRVLFPESLRRANEVIRNSKNLDLILKRPG